MTYPLDRNIGQENAINAVANALVRYRKEAWRDPPSPDVTRNEVEEFMVMFHAITLHNLGLPPE